MARRVFYRLHYEPDNRRAATVRNIGSIEGNGPANNRPTTDSDANAAMRARIEQVCRKGGYEPSVICTPNELMETNNGNAPD